MFEIVELIDGIKYLANNGDLNSDTVKKGILNFTNPNSASIMKRARANICQFPLLVSNALPAEDYIEVASMLERLYATYIRMTIVNNSEIIDLQNKESVGTLLRNIHQNDYANYGFGDTEQRVSRVTDVFNESYIFKPTEKNEIIKANRDLLKPYLENFNMSSLNLNEAARNAQGNDRPDQSILNLRNDYLRARRNPGPRTEVDEYGECVYVLNSLYDKDHDLNSPQAQEMLRRIQELDPLINERIRTGVYNNNDDAFRRIESIKSVADYLQNKLELDIKSDLSNEKDRTQIQKDLQQIELFKAQIDQIQSKTRNFKQSTGKVTTDIVIKKNNELEPSILEMELFYNNGNDIQSTKIAIGVKCISHLIPYEELCYFIPDCLIKKKATFRFIQWTTGEIKFAKDFLLDLDNVKFQATSEKESIRWWRHLHSRSNAARIRGAFNPKEPLIPNASIVLSMQDIEFIRIKDHIDLFNKNKNMVTKLMHYYFLINFVIVDSADNMIYLWNEDSGDWERYTFKQLDKETQDAMKRNNRISLR